MNYIGNKYRLLPQMMPLFPEKIDCFMDLFCGGLDVSINIDAEKKYANDINYYLIDIYKAFQEYNYKDIKKYLTDKIKEYDLSKTNKEGYVNFREYYNTNSRKPLDLYLLMNYSFNYQIRFNNKHEFNNPFGRNRSSFNTSIQNRLELFVKSIEDITFSSMDFREVPCSDVTFIYADPAYSLSIGSYNDGKRGFNGWTLEDDYDLMKYLDEADRKGIQFALSNVLVHKGKTHDALIEWSKKYNVHDIKSTYSNCNYQTKNKYCDTREVLITNY